jgi:hypothetical protein
VGPSISGAIRKIMKKSLPMAGLKGLADAPLCQHETARHIPATEVHQICRLWRFLDPLFLDSARSQMKGNTVRISEEVYVMKRIVRNSATLLGLCLYPGTGIVRASVIANSSLSLTQFQILPSSGSIRFLSPVTATGFAQTQDSLGGLDQQSNTIDDAAALAAASTTLANANAAASAPARTASAVTGVNLSGIDASSSSTARSGLSGAFEIVGASSPVDVLFEVLLAYIQSLTTTDGGQSATSELSFSLTLDDGDQPLFFDNILPAAPDSTISTSSSPQLNGAATLDPNTEYSFILKLDSETSGRNTPEPSTIFLAISGLITLAVRRRAVIQKLSGGLLQ